MVNVLPCSPYRILLLGKYPLVLGAAGNSIEAG